MLPFPGESDRKMAVALQKLGEEVIWIIFTGMHVLFSYWLGDSDGLFFLLWESTTV
jgi:hypothetical protein